MKVILLENIENLGKKHEVKNVNDGHARNFLIPKGLAKLATKKNMEWLKQVREEQNMKAEEDLKEAQMLASKIDGLEVEILMKIGKRDKVFGSIGPLKIAERLKEMGLAIGKNQIELAKPIKELGEFPVKIKLKHNLEAEIMLIVNKLEED